MLKTPEGVFSYYRCIHITSGQEKKSSKLYKTIKKQENSHPEAAFLAASDLRHMVPYFHQHVFFTTRGDKVIDHCSLQGSNPFLFPIRQIRS